MVTMVTTPQVNLLNCLEQMGYRVVTSGDFVATQMVKFLILFKVTAVASKDKHG